MQAVAIGGIGLVILAGAAYYMSTSTDPTAVQIQKSTQSGKTPFSSNVTLPRSFNEEEGATFSYEGWFSVNDFTYGFGKKRVIFNHGDVPGMYIDTTSNSILITIQTYGSMETVMISNIPAQKWVHFAIVVTQYSVDVYINGTLRQHHTLTQLPKQMDIATVIGDRNNGFDGQVGGLTYYSRALSPVEVSSRAFSSPPPSLIQSPASGQYLDMTWYTGR
jgi:hypothetical protein